MLDHLDQACLYGRFAMIKFPSCFIYSSCKETIVALIAKNNKNAFNLLDNKKFTFIIRMQAEFLSSFSKTSML